MTTEEIIKEIASLPSEARREIEDFVLFLRERYGSSKNAKRVGDLRTEEFVGMWADRDDMSDSSAWVREVRDKHWSN
jgi:hypothetical protein